MSTIIATTVQAGTIQTTAGGAVTLTKQEGTKAWCYFNGCGTVVVNDSFNEAGLTDVATGRYTLSFTNTMGSTNYAVAYKGGTTYNGANSNREVESPTLSTGSMELYSGSSGTGAIDVANYHTHVHGDLA